MADINIPVYNSYGSFKIIEIKGRKVSLCGLSSDISKLPTTEDFASSSIAYCIDTGDLYMWEEDGKEWYLQ